MEASKGKPLKIYQRSPVSIDSGEPPSHFSEKTEALQDISTAGSSTNSLNQNENSNVTILYNPLQSYVVPVEDSDILTSFDSVKSGHQNVQIISVDNMESLCRMKFDNTEPSSHFPNQTEISPTGSRDIAKGNPVEQNSLTYSMSVLEENGQTIVKIVYDSLGTNSVPAKDSELLTSSIASAKSEDQQRLAKLDEVESPRQLNFTEGELSYPIPVISENSKGKSLKPSKRTIQSPQNKPSKKSKVKPKTPFEIMCEQFLASANKSHMLKKD